MFENINQYLNSYYNQYTNSENLMERYNNLKEYYERFNLSRYSLENIKNDINDKIQYNLDEINKVLNLIFILFLFYLLKDYFQYLMDKFINLI
jgi:hypothetical protein|uniref:Uncharacterized protein n=1 Tax=viral metagenome TaxID=1070528 RepID=A0A6C0BTB8_9ZZZZ